MTKKKTLDQHIKENKEEIDKAIKERVPNIGEKLDQEERRLWVLNDEALYNAAKKNGADI